MLHFLYHGFFRNIFSEIKLLFLLLRKPWEIYPRFCTGISFSNCVMKSVCWRNAFVFFFSGKCVAFLFSLWFISIYTYSKLMKQLFLPTSYTRWPWNSSFKQNIEGPTKLSVCWLSWVGLLNSRKGLILFHLIYSFFFKKCFVLLILL